MKPHPGYYVKKGEKLMSSNNGYMREDEMIYHLDQKLVSELSPASRTMMEEMFGYLDNNETIRCVKADEYLKPDVLITYQGKTKGLSLKSGKSETLHKESVKTLIPFLRELGVSKRTLQTILLFQFGDGTLDGTGKERIPTDKLKYLLCDRIIEANTELNKDVEFILKVADRVMFDGIDDQSEKAAAIYHGVYDDGVIVTKTQFVKYIKYRTWNHYDSLHIGPLFFRPHARYINKPIKHEEYRFRIEFHWPRLVEDMYYISKRYSSYIPVNKRKEQEQKITQSVNTEPGR